MTRLTRNVTRLVVAVERNGRASELVVTLTLEGCYVRRPRQRQSSAYFIPYAMLEQYGGTLAAAKRRREKRQARKARKEER